MPPTPNVDCIPGSFRYLVCNEEGPITLPRVNKGVPGKSGSVKENTREPIGPY